MFFFTQEKDETTHSQNTYQTLTKKTNKKNEQKNQWEAKSIQKTQWRIQKCKGRNIPPIKTILRKVGKTSNISQVKATLKTIHPSQSRSRTKVAKNHHAPLRPKIFQRKTQKNFRRSFCPRFKKSSKTKKHPPPDPPDPTRPHPTSPDLAELIQGTLRPRNSATERLSSSNLGVPGVSGFGVVVLRFSCFKCCLGLVL